MFSGLQLLRLMICPGKGKKPARERLGENRVYHYRLSQSVVVCSCIPGGRSVSSGMTCHSELMPGLTLIYRVIGVA